MEIKIITHFPTDDEDCNGDYYDVEVQIDGKVVASFGDYYHDKGQDKAEAWKDGYIAAMEQLAPTTQVTVDYDSVADRDD